MQSMESTGSAGAERRRVEAVVETLAAIHNHGESLGELAHDARNMVTALSLYCDLLEEPGVLPPAHRHYGSELRLVAEASRRLVEKLAHLDPGEEADSSQTQTASTRQGSLFSDAPQTEWPTNFLHLDPMLNGLIENFRDELLASRNLLDAIAGPSMAVTVAAEGGAWPVKLSSENLIRALVNLVKNAAECGSGTGSIRLRLSESRDPAGAVRSLLLSVEDSGRGIPDELLEKVFEAGFTTRAGERPKGSWDSGHRGLGLSITRSIIEGAGGSIHAENAVQGARLVIELPVRKH